MLKGLVGTTVVFAVALGLGLRAAWAEAKVTVTREENKPSTVEVKVDEGVWFVNASGGVAHVSFGDSPIEFRNVGFHPYPEARRGMGPGS